MAKKMFYNGEIFESEKTDNNDFSKHDDRLNIGNLSSNSNTNPLNIGSNSNEGNVIPSTLLSPSIDLVIFPIQVMTLLSDIKNFIDDVDNRIKSIERIGEFFSSTKKRKSYRSYIDTLKKL